MTFLTHSQQPDKTLPLGRVNMLPTRLAGGIYHFHCVRNGIFQAIGRDAALGEEKPAPKIAQVAHSVAREDVHVVNYIRI